MRFPHVGLNQERAHYVCAYKGSAKKRMHTLMVWLRVVRLSLALPGLNAWDAPSLSRRPDYYGMEPASPGRLSFHASAFASVPDVSELPPRIRYPLRAGARTSPAQAAMTTSPKPILDGAAPLSGGIPRGGQHVSVLHLSICSAEEHDAPIDALGACMAPCHIKEAVVRDLFFWTAE